MKKVVTVTLGSSKRDFEFKTDFLGQSFSVRLIWILFQEFDTGLRKFFSSF